MKLLDFAIQTQQRLNKIKDGQLFATFFINSLLTFYRDYTYETKIVKEKEIKSGLVISCAHGIDIFKNIIKYYDTPDLYKETNSGNSEYEENFRKILKINKNA